jgi:hypothetical protein
LFYLLYIYTDSSVFNKLIEQSRLTDWKRAIRQIMQEFVGFLPRVTSHTAQPLQLKYWLEQTINPSSPEFQKAHEIVAQIRRATDPTEIKKLKCELPGITPGCLIESGKQRIHANIKSLTGWIQIDIDGVDKPEHLRDAVARIVYVAYCGLSASGRGIWGLVKVEDPLKSKLYFTQLVHDFGVRGIELDRSKGPNPTDCRFYSLDKNAIIKEDYQIYTRLPVPKFNRLPQSRRRRINKADLFEQAMEYVKKKGYNFQKGSYHNSIFYLCCYLNRKGVPQSEAEAWIHNNILPLEQVTTNCINRPYQAYGHEHGLWSEI